MGLLAIGCQERQPPAGTLASNATRQAVQQVLDMSSQSLVDIGNACDQLLREHYEWGPAVAIEPHSDGIPHVLRDLKAFSIGIQPGDYEFYPPSLRIFLTDAASWSVGGILYWTPSTKDDPIPWHGFGDETEGSLVIVTAEGKSEFLWSTRESEDNVPAKNR